MTGGHETPEEAASSLERALRAVGTRDRAVHEKRYLKSDLDFLGASVGQIERAVRTWTAELPSPPGHDELLLLADALWRRPVHERRMAAVMLLERHVRLLTPADLCFVERLLRESRTWALVDGISTDVAGAILAADPEGTRSVLDRWATDADFWVRRASLLSELRPLRRGAPLEPFLRRADAMLDEREFFIRKAIGWVLREVGKRRPTEVVAWLEPRITRASGVTVREAVKYLPDPDRERLLAGYRARR
ncbi:MAG TPA: DNA alkylation repair protein [Candidatus Limnocylindria bacterium]|nr:DNA alkylation repair protein [Candidatus Limnocylindria bacterium]